MTDLPFVSALVQADLPVWEQCLQTEFLQKMENGTLSEDCFKSYLVEDSLYLREYAKIFAWGMTKATTMAAMRTYYSLLSFVQENEDLTRLRYLEQYGLREADIQSLPLRPENRAYLDCMIDAARNGEGRSRVPDGLPALYAELWLAVPEAFEALPRRKGYLLRRAGAGLRQPRLRRRLPHMGRTRRSRLHRSFAGARRPLPRDLPHLLGARASLLGDVRRTPDGYLRINIENPEGPQTFRVLFL